MSSSLVTCSDVAVDLAGGVATISLQRPAKRNAVTREMWLAITGALAQMRDRADIHLLVVQGSEGVFSAGADLQSVKNPDGTPSAEFHAIAMDALKAIETFPAPSVALIDGPCIGGGCSIALACDIRFATPGATFGIPAVRHGIVYERESLSRLIQLTGPSRAARLMYTAERIDGRRAAAIGLVDECVTDLDGVARSFAAQIAIGDRATIAATHAIMRGHEIGLAHG